MSDKAKPEPLKKGDILYEETRFNGIRKVEINRTTPKIAYSEYFKFKKEIDASRFQQIGAGNIGSWFYLDSEEWRAKYREQNLRKWISRSHEDFSIEFIEEIYESFCQRKRSADKNKA